MLSWSTVLGVTFTTVDDKLRLGWDGGSLEV